MAPRLPQKFDEAAEMAMLMAIIRAFVAAHGTPARGGPAIPGDIMDAAATSMGNGYTKDAIGQHYRKQMRGRQFVVGAPGHPNQFYNPNASGASTPSTPATKAKAGSKRKRTDIKTENEESDNEVDPAATKPMGPNVNEKKKDDDPDEGGAGTGGHTGMLGGPGIAAC